MVPRPWFHYLGCARVELLHFAIRSSGARTATEFVWEQLISAPLSHGSRADDAVQVRSLHEVAEDSRQHLHWLGHLPRPFASQMLNQH